MSPTVEQLYKIQEAGFDYIQIHGTLEKAVYEADTIPIIRAVNISDNNNADKTDNIINTVKEQVEKVRSLIKLLEYFLMQVFRVRVRRLTGTVLKSLR